MVIHRRELLLGSIGGIAAAGLGLGVPRAMASNAVGGGGGGGAPTALDWMASVDGGLSLASLTIPGTHDTCALNRTPWVRCQSYGTHDQLRMGVRFFDLRPSDSASMKIFHGPVDVDNSMINVLDNCREFLDEHPTETVLVSIKQENTDSSAAAFGARWRQTTAKYRDILHTSSRLPTLAQARGRVVVVSRAEGVPGVPWSSATVSDAYKVGSVDEARDKKWPTVQRALETAAKGSRSKLHITFCSGTGFPRVDPGDVNDVIEPRLRTWLNKRPGRRGERLGVVLVDFAKRGKIEQIAARNFGRNSF